MTTQNHLVALYHCVFSGSAVVTEFEHEGAKELYNTLPNLWAVNIVNSTGASMNVDAVLFVKTNMTEKDKDFMPGLVEIIAQIPTLANIPRKGTRLIPNPLMAAGQPLPADYLRIALERYSAPPPGGHNH